ncbi:hypothetical protein OJF2_18770 [Aquisphaera giovannonii]|uniref:Uncharacterized protein n=1 Tax=Aquisphaera giovannonii TaxID=406548 RepID=A0A5B9VYC4_9BACT|nr:hypothetical protein [Aquisphaera giovannonii]QEH33376.1 hypothetical protein OJF2_18770 [Aquisphaera giovannonii]
MAIKTSLSLIARRISDSVRRAAARQGLAEGDYALAGIYYDDSDRISLRVGTDRQIDDRRWFADAMNEIRQAFPEDPTITYFIGLVVRKVKNLDEVYWDTSDSEDAQDMTELLNRPRG